jgi:hypothetical protein
MNNKLLKALDIVSILAVVLFFTLSVLFKNQIYIIFALLIMQNNILVKILFSACETYIKIFELKETFSALEQKINNKKGI